ncbi:hypothetical protein CYMTET_32515 [Cymbomonas tetramitiformis]|uniref:Uncharacterized protein n=1 Tax=Cymbomonas tetramitiformis TaxID=36881 RepID=A0AAE0FEW6_9CHLO|nr:hypothetical protein CYMTET_32515 [Cymbomonas tetramitiformis]
MRELGGGDMARVARGRGEQASGTRQQCVRVVNADGLSVAVKACGTGPGPIEALKMVPQTYQGPTARFGSDLLADKPGFGLAWAYEGPVHILRYWTGPDLRVDLRRTYREISLQFLNPDLCPISDDSDTAAAYGFLVRKTQQRFSRERQYMEENAEGGEQVDCNGDEDEDEEAAHGRAVQGWKEKWARLLSFALARGVAGLVIRRAVGRCPAARLA